MVTFLTLFCRGLPLIIGNVSEDRCFVVQVGASIGRLQEEAKAIKNDLSAAHSQQKSRQTSKILSDFEVCSSMCKTGRRHLMLSRNSAFLSSPLPALHASCPCSAHSRDRAVSHQFMTLV